jgi:hypothetical protein
VNARPSFALRPNGGRRELPSIVPHDRVDEDPQIEYDLGFSDPNAAVADRCRA